MKPRRGLCESNLLHLNRLRGACTHLADVFAIVLLCLAVSRAALPKARTGPAGRGKWLVGAGLILPLAFPA